MHNLNSFWDFKQLAIRLETTCLDLFLMIESNSLPAVASKNPPPLIFRIRRRRPLRGDRHPLTGQGEEFRLAHEMDRTSPPERPAANGRSPPLLRLSRPVFDGWGKGRRWLWVLWVWE